MDVLVQERDGRWPFPESMIPSAAHLVFEWSNLTK